MHNSTAKATTAPAMTVVEHSRASKPVWSTPQPPRIERPFVVPAERTFPWVFLRAWWRLP